MADSYYGGGGDAPSLADESTRGEMDELLILLEEKDADLRRAAELGKMLLDEKEADAEAHEGEKEALWRRIQDMARRVMELEQEAAESRDEFSLQQQDQAYHQHNQHQPLAAEGGSAGGGGFGRRVSVGGGGGGDRAEERALRAKNEMLERQLAHMREAAEEAQLELAAAKKAQFSRRSFRHHTRSRRSYSILSSPAASSRLGRAERSLSGGAFSAALGPLSPAGSCSPGHFPTAAGAAAVGGGGSTCVTPSHRHHRRSSSRLSSSAAPASRWSVRSYRSAWGEGVGDDGGDDDGADSEASNDELRAADRAHASAWSGRMEAGGVDSDGSEEEGGGGGGAAGDDDGGADDHEAAWLLEQNAWLMEELESKDELIEALREQLEELRHQQQRQQGRQERHPSAPSTPPPGGRDQPADSDDSDDSDDNDSESGQRSFLDHLLQASGGGKPTNQLTAEGGATSCSTGAAKEAPRDTTITICADAFPGAAGEVGPARARRATLGVAREKRRSFGGILTENTARNDTAAAENPGAETATGNTAQSKSPTRAGGDHNRDGENSPVRATSDLQRRAFSPTRRGAAAAAAAAEQESVASRLSPARPGHSHPAGGELTGVVRQTHDAAAAGAAAVAASAKSGGVSGNATTPGTSTTAAAAVSVSEEVTGRTETKEVATGTPQQQQQQQQQQQRQERQTVVSSSSAAPSATPVSVNTAPLPPTAAAAMVASPGVVARETTVSSRKKAAAAAKAKAREQEAAAAAAAAAEAKQREEASSSSLAQMSRAEKKSRQAMEKLGLRTVKGVFRMTMRTTNGVVFVVKAPDVFKHPQQDTFVVFGAADTDQSGGEVSHGYRPPPRGFTPVTTSVSLDGKTGSTGATATSSRPDPSAVESESVSAGLDPADVLTIVSHAGCSPRAAIGALREAGGDVVNAVMNLTDASSASV